MIQFENEYLTVFQSVLYQTTTAIVKTDEAIIMTDPNWLPQEVEEIQVYIEQIIGQRKLYIIYTHSDYDHIIGAGAFPNATTIASKAFCDRIDKEAVLQQIHQFDAQYYVERRYPVLYPTVDIVIEQDGQQLQLGETICTFYFAPGHTKDGLFTIIAPLGILLAGDYLSNVEFPFVENVNEYMSTLHKVQALFDNHQFSTLVPGHGATTDDEQQIMRRIQQSLEYLILLRTNMDLEPMLKERYLFYNGLKAMHVHNKATI